jgi:hypothetical protein
MNGFQKLSMKWGKTKSEHQAYFRWWRKQNRDADNARKSVWSHKNLEKKQLSSLKSHLKKKFNLTVAGYEELVSRANSKCAICGAEPKKEISGNGKSNPRLHIDHCHKTGKVRGLLCFNCNAGLGQFKDDVSRLEKAIGYLETFKTEQRAIDDAGEIFIEYLIEQEGTVPTLLKAKINSWLWENCGLGIKDYAENI